MIIAERVRIVLVEPEFPGNIGSTARAMQTMGLSQLFLVKPACDPLAEEAFWLAHSAADILRQATVVASLEEALSDTVFSVGTTRRIRRQAYPIYTPEETATLVLERSVSNPAAIVFGRESKGLTNPELAMCSIQSTIPTMSEKHSLNLAQSVMLYCYAIFQESLKPSERSHTWNLASHAQMETFYQNLGEAFRLNGLQPATTMENYIARFRRVLGRVPLEPRDVNLLHKLVSRLRLAGQSPATQD
jgi:TrmH family RNA methyltransferase